MDLFCTKDAKVSMQVVDVFTVYAVRRTMITLFVYFFAFSKKSERKTQTGLKLMAAF